MPNVYVRKEKCEGCLYSASSIDCDADISRKLIKEDAEIVFYCHCFSGKENTGLAICKGFYDVHKSRLNGDSPVFTNKKGSNYQYFKKIKPASVKMRKTRIEL